MTDYRAAVRVVPVADLREFLGDALRGAMGHHQPTVDDHTEHYVVNLLTLFSRAETPHEDAPARLARSRIDPALAGERVRLYRAGARRVTRRWWPGGAGPSAARGRSWRR